MRLGVTAALTDRDLGPSACASAAEAFGFDSFWVPEHTHLPVREDVPPALVEGVRLDAKSGGKSGDVTRPRERGGR